MDLNDIDITTLFVNRYVNCQNYSCNFQNAPRPFHSVAIMLNGTGTLFYKTNSIDLNPGDLFYIPQGATYSSNWKTDDKNSQVAYFSMHFSFEKQLKDFCENTYLLQKFSVDSVDDVVRKYEKLQENLLLSPENNFRSVSIFFEILSVIFPKMAAVQNNSAMRKIQPAIDYLKSNYARKISVQQLSSLCFLSKSRFFSLFKKQTGMSPIQYRNQYKLKQAARHILIYPCKSIEEIAEEFDYSSPVFFIRQFKKHFGLTPLQYKNKKINAKL